MQWLKSSSTDLFGISLVLFALSMSYTFPTYLYATFNGDIYFQES